VNIWRVPLGVLCGVVLLTQMVQPASAAPVTGDIAEYKQSNGTVVPVRVWGDEFCRVMESLDGYSVIPDEKKDVICYAKLSGDGRELVSTGTPVRKGQIPTAQINTLGVEPHIRILPEAAREKAEAACAQHFAAEKEVLQLAQGYIPPSTSNAKGITILVDFSDYPATNPGVATPAEIATFLNSTTTSLWGNNGSVRDYYEDVSNGNLIYTNWVTSYYYRAAQLRLDYSSPDLAHECLQHLEDAGFDFSQYDSNQDGFVDAVTILTAGPVNGSGLCWPTVWLTNDGVTVNRFIILCALTGPAGLGLGIVGHETGHMICGFPNLYNGLFVGGGGAGGYCLMSAFENMNPPHFCAPLKLKAGWMTVTDFTTPQDNIAVTAESNACYRFAHPTNPDEFFLIYNRQKVNRDAGIFDAGLAIWHVDWAGNNSWAQMTPSQHYMVSLEQADGEFHLERFKVSGDENEPKEDMFHAGGYTEFSEFTIPDSDWWDGTPSGLFIHSISDASTTMTFSFGVTGDLQVSDPRVFSTTGTEGAEPAQTSFAFTLSNTGA